MTLDASLFLVSLSSGVIAGDGCDISDRRLE
jgi:hypothetical protein